MTLGEIIKQYRVSNNLSMGEFAKMSGISKAYISLLEKNAHPTSGKPIAPSIQCIKQAAHGMGMNFDTLFEMIDSNVTLSNSIKHVQKKGVTINVLGYVAAGIPIDAIENIIDTEEISQDLATTGNFFGLQIHGDSMEPRICDGDIVIVRQQNTAENGEIVIAIVNGDKATCKRLRKYRDGIELISLNPAYKPMFYSNKDIQNIPVQIIGKVVELRGKF